YAKDFSIVFVHGLFGGSCSTWTASSPQQGPSVLWPKQLLPIDLACTPCRILTYGYDSTIWKPTTNAGSGSIWLHAANLTQSLASERRSCPGRPLIFVAHSLGGLIVKDMLLTAKDSPNVDYNQLTEDTASVLFLGTPHRGSKSADFGSVIAGVLRVVSPTNVNSRLIDQLRPSNGELGRIERSFPGFLERRKQHSSPVHVACFMEMNTMRGFRNYVVDERSSTIDGYMRIPIDADHSAMAKFESRENQSYRNFLIHDAIFDDDTEALRRILGSGCFNLNDTVVAPGVGPAICFAAHFGSVNTFKMLAEHRDVNIDIEDPEHHQRPLFRAVKSESGDGRHLAIVRYLLDSGKVSIDAQDLYKKTALFVAAEKGIVRGVEMLLEKGADCTLKANPGMGQPDLPYAAAYEEQSKYRPGSKMYDRYTKILALLEPYAARCSARHCVTGGVDMNSVYTNRTDEIPFLEKMSKEVRRLYTYMLREKETLLWAAISYYISIYA
ncbi:hypothetical protein CKAH01_14032, partial [Colletotrichum kahawae]